MESAVQDGERLHVEDLDVDRRPLQELRALVDEGAGHAHGENLVGALVGGRAQDLGVQHGLIGGKETELPILHLERGNDARGRKGRQAHLTDDDLGATHRGHHGLAVGSRVGQGEVNSLVDRLSLGFGSYGSATEPRDDQVIAAPFEGESLDGARTDVQPDHLPLAQETTEHWPSLVSQLPDVVGRRGRRASPAE